MLKKTTVAGIALSLAMTLSLRAETSPGGAEQLSAGEIAEKNVAARGGLQTWRSIQAIAMSGKMDAGGNKRSALPMPGPKSGAQMPPPRPLEQVQLPFTVEMKRPHKMRVELQVQGQTAIQTFDGAHGWKLRPFLGRNDVEPFTEQEVKAALMESELDGPLVDYAAKGTTVELAGRDKVDGKDAYKLKLTMKDGQVRHLWIDAQSFLDVKIDGLPRKMDGRMHPVEVYMRDYKTVSGVTVPYLLETEVQGIQPTHMMVIETVVVNPKIDDAAFTVPKVAGKTAGK
jgi:hypothetical protein